MSSTTKIQWTNRTWNPWRGCDKIHPRCKNCYMFTEQIRYGKDPSVVVRTKTWVEPLKWQREAQAAGRFDLVFTCSWSDWFHADADEWRDEAWAVVKACPNMTFQILTKRPERIASHLPKDWGQGYPNVWLGSSLDPQDKNGIAILDVPAKVRFLSLEPLLSPVELGLKEYNYDRNTNGPAATQTGFHWVIVGGESGAGARHCNIEWIRQVVQQCAESGTPVFVKQLGARPLSGASSIALHFKDKKGGDMSEWPADIRVRQFPNL